MLYDPAGLGSAEVRARRQRFGENTILQGKANRWLSLAGDTVHDPMIWFLIGTAVLFAWLGDAVEAMVLALAIVPLVGMDAFLHWRTQASTEGLRQRLASQTTVLRDGAETGIPASELVPGDLVVLNAGDWAPADGLIEAGQALQADQSSLTGEAMPIVKHAFAKDRRIVRGAMIEDQYWLFAGVRVLTGSARLRVAFTGADTIYGQIVRSVQAGRAEATPIQRAINRLVSVLLIAALVACAALALARLLQGYGPVDAALSAVTLGVAALPEEFPVVFTFFLGVGVFRLAQRRALVRRAVAVENIGRVSVICSDKTGTLTEGRLKLEHVHPAPGYDAASLMRIAIRASRRESADPLDAAILENGTEARPSIAVFPFTEDRRRESAVVRDGEGFVVSLKGAPETVLTMTGASAAEIAAWSAQTGELAATAHKVIACAEQRMPAWDGDEPQGGYVFAGLLAFEDPIRVGAREAVADARAAGIRTIMVTGDHAATARAVAAALGIGNGAPLVIDGEALMASLEGDGEEMLRKLDVVARATPAQKLALVERLRRGGEIVAVTGDGVNDAPALRAADVGVAMGQRGAQTSRDVASIVLLDDSFDTIVHAIAEGRQLFRNLRLAFAYLLMVHGPLVVTAALIPFLGEPLLYLPAHIVWLELIFHPTALLAFQALPEDGGRRIGARSTASFFDSIEWGAIAAVAGVTALLVFGCYQLVLAGGFGATYARSAALALLVFSSAAIAAALSRLKTIPAMVVCGATVGSVFALIQIPAVAALLHLAPLRPAHLATAIGMAAAIGASTYVAQSLASDRSARRRDGQKIAAGASRA